MVIRRIREHVAAHNWFAVAVDVGIVVAGRVHRHPGQQLERGPDRARAAPTIIGRELIDELRFQRTPICPAASPITARPRLMAWRRSPISMERRPLSDRDFLIDGLSSSRQVDTTKAKTGVYEEITAAGLVDQLGGRGDPAIASDFYLSVEAAQRANRHDSPLPDIASRGDALRRCQSQIRERMRRSGSLLQAAPGRDQAGGSMRALPLDPAMAAGQAARRSGRRPTWSSR